MSRSHIRSIVYILTILVVGVWVVATKSSRNYRFVRHHAAAVHVYHLRNGRYCYESGTGRWYWLAYNTANLRCVEDASADYRSIPYSGVWWSAEPLPPTRQEQLEIASLRRVQEWIAYSVWASVGDVPERDKDGNQLRPECVLVDAQYRDYIDLDGRYSDHELEVAERTPYVPPSRSDLAYLSEPRSDDR